MISEVYLTNSRLSHSRLETKYHFYVFFRDIGSEDLQLDVYEEMPPWEIKRVLEAFRCDHNYIGKGKHQKEDKIVTPVLELQQTLTQKVDLLKVENWSLTKNLKFLEKDYVLAMKSRVSSNKTKNG